MSKLDHPITVKVTDEMAAHVKGLAAMDGMESSSEWVRHVVCLAIEERMKQRDALNAIFAPDEPHAKVNLVCRGVPASVFHG